MSDPTTSMYQGAHADQSGSPNKLPYFIKTATNNASYSYPENIENDELGYIRYDLYPHKTRQQGTPVGSHGHINLHMPAEITDGLEAEWAQEEDVLTKGLSMVSSANEGRKNLSTGELTTAGVGRQFGLAAFTTAMELESKLSGLLGGTLSVGMKGLARRQGLVANPHEVHFFKNVSYRTFSFTHKLAAFSSTDSENIREIIRLFRYASAPSVTPAMKSQFQYPGEFHIGFYNKSNLNTYLPQIWGCVCTQVEVNYAGSSTWSQFASGAPTDVDLTLSFQETVLPTKEVIKKEVLNYKKADIDHKARSGQIFEQRDADLRTGVGWIDAAGEYRTDQMTKAITQRN